MSMRKRAASSFNFHFKGINELRVKLKKNTDLDLVRDAVMLNTSEMQQKAQRKAPVDTGFMKRSIGIALRDKGFTGHVIVNANYAPYVEFGTRFMYAQPFMRPSYKEQVKQFKRDLNRLMK